MTLSVSFDIWNWWQTGYQANQAQAQLAQAQEGLSMTKDGVLLEVTQSYLGVKQYKERKAVAEQGENQAEENYRVTDDTLGYFRASKSLGEVLKTIMVLRSRRIGRE